VQLLTLHKKITDDALLMRKAVESVLTPMSQQRYRGPSMYIAPFLSRLNEVTTLFKVNNELVDDTTVDPVPDAAQDPSASANRYTYRVACSSTGA